MQRNRNTNERQREREKKIEKNCNNELTFIIILEVNIRHWNCSFVYQIPLKMTQTRQIFYTLSMEVYLCFFFLFHWFVNEAAKMA